MPLAHVNSSNTPERIFFVFRPGIIVPLYGAKSKTAIYRVFYTLTKPLLPLLRTAFRNHVLTAE